VILTSYLLLQDHNFLILSKTLCECATMLVKKQLCPVYSFDEIHSDMKEKINSLRESELLMLRRFGHAKMCSGLRQGSIKKQIQCSKTCCFLSAMKYYPMKPRPVECRKKRTTDPDVT